MHFMRARAFRLCFGLLASVASIAIGATESHIKVKGLERRAEILIDQWGVPHIYAATAHDAFFAQGWNAARDRLWQMDLWRRSGLGELSAALGPSYLAQDRAIRLFVYRGDMEREWAAYGPDAKQDTEAFVAGINAYVAAIKGKAAALPIEFKLAGYEPAFWKPEDIVRIRIHGFLYGLELQSQRAQLICKTGSATSISAPPFKISPAWTPIIPDGLDPCSIPANVLEQYQLAKKPVTFGGKISTTASIEPQSRQTVEAPLTNPGEGQGSNNWVIAPSKSTTGRPILANDPHRELAVPALRYVAQISAPGINVIGAGEPALPGIIVGHNEDIAFGLTIFLMAQDDLYVYDTNPDNLKEYRYQGKWESMRRVQETVQVRGQGDSQVELEFTRHGPVVLEDPAHHRTYAVKASWLDTGGTHYFPSMAYLRARNVTQFAAALKHWGGPGENQIYADRTGQIAWFPSGFTPIRPNSDGLLPLPGDGRYEWHGYLDRDLLPSEINPGRGYIATANQMNLPKDFPYRERRVSFFWVDDNRFNRISEVLDGLPRVSIANSEALQNDHVSLSARTLMGVLKGIKTMDPKLQDMLNWLTAWDCRIEARSPRAALYELWMAHHLGPTVIERIAPAISEKERAAMGTPRPIVDLMEHPDSQLGPHPQQARDDLILETLVAAERELERLQGSDRSQWQWGKIATVLFEHPLAPLMNAAQRPKWNLGPAPMSGDADVVGVAHYGLQDFHDELAASFRMVLDVGQWDNSMAVNSPGQSGDPESPHYRDLFPLWLEGKYFPLLYTRAAVEKVTEEKVVIEP
jgi:penicillin amidase